MISYNVLKSRYLKWIGYEWSSFLAGIFKFGSGKRYTPFIILGKGRTGSNLLRGLLNSHSDVYCFGELFRDSNKELISVKKWSTAYFRLKSIKKGAIKFLESKIFRNYLPKMRAVGFKIFYPHAQNGDNRVVWNYLIDKKDLKVVHITRRNMLKTFFSLKKALLTDSWIDKGENTSSVSSLKLDYKECLNEFINIRKFEEEFREKFKNHDVIEIVYEDMIADMKGTMEKLQNFLNVSVRELKPNTKKQRNLPLSQSISNYEELKKQFKGSEWEVFFAE